MVNELSSFCAFPLDSTVVVDRGPGDHWAQLSTLRYYLTSTDPSRIAAQPRGGIAVPYLSHLRRDIISDGEGWGSFTLGQSAVSPANSFPHQPPRGIKPTRQDICHPLYDQIPTSLLIMNYPLKRSTSTQRPKLSSVEGLGPLGLGVLCHC